ncbi:MAG: hypothetical protein FWG52_04965 [Proteobacteria bacterium]|nr:hypothetical protein [Pseudomonadota bacterium]
MKKRICFEIDEDIARKAEAIYFSTGIDTETALSIFMRRTVLENRLPIDMHMVVAASTPATPPPMEKRAKRVPITPRMVEVLWDAFKEHRSKGGDIWSISNHIAKTTDMSPGSASMYMVILNNLVVGKQNTRNMKIEDLKYYMSKIKSEYGDETFNKALDSLEQSVPYWRQKIPGRFADRVRDYLKKNGR